MDEQKRENNLEGSSFLGFDSRFLGKCHQKTVNLEFWWEIKLCVFFKVSNI